MKISLRAVIATLILMAALSVRGYATVLTFAKNSVGGTPSNNEDLDVPYGSNITASNVIGATNGGEGFTPNIALVWAPTGGTIPNDPDIDVLEFHSASTFSGASLTVPVLQLDVDISNHTLLPEHPTIDFVPEPDYAVRIYDFKYGNATDQGLQAPHPWTFSILELPSLTPTGTSFTTAALGPGDHGTATFNFTGQPGVSYRMLFDDGDLSCTSFDCHNPRTGIDELRFGQAVPGVSGDYNNNGTVDAADYVLWRNGGPLQNEGSSIGVVDASDYTFWRSRFGATSGSGGGIAPGNVPEPSTATILLGLVVSAAAATRWSMRK